MPIFKEERTLDIPVEQQDMPTPALGSPVQAPVPTPPSLPSSRVGSGGGTSTSDKSRMGLSGEELSRLAKVPKSTYEGPNLIPIGEVVANKRYNTYVRNMDLENIYGLQQSWLDQLGNSAVKFAATTVGTFAQQFATTPNTIRALKNTSFAELSGRPDGYEASIDGWLKNLEDNFPNYFTKWEREHPFLSAITPSGAANFWGDKIIKNLGFMAGAISGAAVQDAAVGAITEGIGAVPLIASQIGKASLWLNKIFTGTKNIDKALDLGRAVGATTESILSAKKLGEIAAGMKVLDKFKYTTALYGASRTEAAVEAREAYRTIKEELIREHIKQTGEEPDGKALEEIESYATNGMNVRFGVNMALLTVSNAVQFGNIFKSFTSSAKKGAQQFTKEIDDLGRVGLKEKSLDVFEKVTPKTKTGRIWEVVKPKIDDIFSEGVFEEGGQFAVQKGVEDYYTRKYKNEDNWDSLSETVNSTLKGLKDQFGSEEGLENMFIGALTAGLTGVVKSSIDKRRGLTNDTRLQQTINILNNQGVTSILSNQYENTLDATGIAKEMEAAVVDGDIFRYKNLKSDMFFNFVNSRIPSGMHDVTIEQLKMLKDLDKDQFESLFAMDFNSSNKNTVGEYVDNLILKANEIKNTVDSLNKTFVNPFDFKRNPTNEQEDLENKNYGIFENWKLDLANYAYHSKEMDSRKESIQQSLSKINPLISASTVESLTNKDSLRELSAEYEEKAIQLEKSITPATPLATARDLRAQARSLRSFSEKINFELSKDERDINWFVNLLNFEINNQDPKAPSVVNLDKAMELFSYGVDLNKMTTTKKILAKKYEALASEEGFNNYFKTAETPEKKKDEEGVATLPPAQYQFINKSGEQEPLELEREYEIPPFKKATIKKLADDRYEVTTPDGNKTFYSSEEDANVAADEANTQFKGLEKVRVVAFNSDGTVKIEDVNGDIYNIPLSKLEGYQKIKTEQEKLEKFKDDIEEQQKELELNDLGSIPSEPFTDSVYKGNPEDFRKSFPWLFWSTTSASEDRSADSKKPHAQRSIAFLNSVRKFPNKKNLRVMVVSPKQEEALGLTGLHKLSTGEDIKKDAYDNVLVEDTDNALIAAVYVEQEGSNFYFVDKDGKRIGKVGDQVDLNQVVFSTMPDTSLYWNEGGEGAERYRIEEEEEAKEMSQRWALKRKQLFELAPDKPEIYSFIVSKGIPIINSLKDRNHVGTTLIEESKIKSQEGLIVVSTKDKISHNGISYSIPAGRAMIQYEDVFVPAVTYKFNRNQAESIFEVLRLLSADIQKQAANNQKIKFDPIYVRYLSNLLYWKKSEKAKGGANQIFIDSKMNMIIGNKKYDITKLESFKKEIVDGLLDAYHTINNKSLSSTEASGINKFYEKFVEFYIENGELKEREWTNYQTYLLSAKYPDGSARSAEDTPITTFVAKPTDSVPYNFKQKYAILSPTEFPALPVKPSAEKPKEPSTAPKGNIVRAGKYDVGTVNAIENTFTGFSSAVGNVTFTAKLNENNELVIEVVDNDISKTAIAKVKGNEKVMSVIEAQLKDQFDYNNIDASVILFMREKIKADLLVLLSKKEEKKGAPIEPTITPIKIGGVEFIPDNLSVYTSKKGFKSGAPVQFRIEGIDEKGYPIIIVKPEDQTSNSISDVSKNADSVNQIDAYLKGINEFKETSSIDERVALFAGIRIYDSLKTQMDEDRKQTPSSTSSEDAAVFTPTTPYGTPTGKPLTTAVSDIEAKKADIERRRQEELNKGALPNVPDYVKEEIDRNVKSNKNLLQKVRELAYQNKTKAEIAKELSVDKEIVNSLRTYLQIPSIDSKTEFEEWKSKIDNINAKYDAELAALEGSKPSEAPSTATPETPPPTPEEKAKPKRKKRGKDHDDNSRFRLVETKPSKKEKITQADIEIFKKWHSEVVPTIPYEISERIFLLNDGRRAYGMFAEEVAKFYRKAIRGTEYHEVFEGIWKAFLTPQERQAILDELRTKSGTFVDRASGKKIRYDEATDQELKERIADDFAEYRLGKIPARTLSEKIVRFFKNIIEFFKNIVTKPSKVDRLFSDIDAGKFKNYTLSANTKNEAPEYRAVEGLSETDTRLYVEDMTVLIFQHIFGTNKSLYDIQQLTDKDLYNFVLQKYQNDEFIDDSDPDYLSTKQFDDLFKETKQFLRRFKIEFDEGMIGDVNNEEADNRNYAPEPFSTDWKKHSGYPIKVLLGTLVRTLPGSEMDANNLRMPISEISDVGGFQLLNFSRAFATVMDKLHNTSSVNKMVQKLVNLASLDTNYYKLLSRLGLNDAMKIDTNGNLNIDFSKFKSHDWRLFIQFYQTFTKQKPTALIQYVSGENVYTAPANLFTAAEELKKDWLSNTIALAKDKKSLVYFDSDKKRYVVGNVSQIPISTPEQKVEFLKKLGINFPLTSYLKLSTKKEIGERTEQAKFDDAVSSIYKYISSDRDLVSITGETLKIDAPIKKLAELYVRVENPPHETTRFNLEGERVNEFAENNHASVFENEMNEAETLDDLLVKRPELNDVFSKSSLVLSKGGLFYDEDGKQIKKIHVEYIEGNKDINSGKDNKVSRMSKGDSAVLQFNQNLNGRYYILIPADSSTEWMINLGNNINYDDVVNGRAWNKIYTIFHNYLNDEVELALSDRSHLINTAPRAKELRFFKDILPEDMVNNIHKIIENDDLSNEQKRTEINEYLKEKTSNFNNSVKDFMISSNQDMRNDLMKYKKIRINEKENYTFELLDADFAKTADVNKMNLSAKEIDDILMFRNINYVINNIELHKIMFGDPYQFKIKDGKLDETKRIKSWLSPRRTSVDFPELNTMLNQERNFAGEIPLKLGDVGYHLYKSHIDTVTFSDVDIAGTIYAKLGMTTETDGFSLMMDYTYKELKIKNGQWIEESAEPWHQWQMAYTRNKLSKKGIYVYDNEKLKAQDEKMISKPAPKHMVEVLKTIATGNKANKNYFDNVLDKFSQMPLYYSMVEGTNLEKLYINMWKQKIGYGVYVSGRKVGAEELHDIYNKKGEFNDVPFTNIIQVPWKALGVQVETTYEEFHDDVTRGSQTTKISTIDLFENGEAIIEGAAEEYKRYVNILNEYHKNGAEELFIKLGLKNLGDGEFEIVDPVTLSESLQHELLSREASDAVRYALELDENNQFRIPFESSNAYKQIRDIMFSMVNKAINSPKTNGGAYVQVPVTGWESLGSSRSLIIKKKDAEGKFIYEKISISEYEKLSKEEQKNVYLSDDTLKMPTPEDPYMEVMLPHWFRTKLPKKYDTDEKILKYLNSTEEGRKLLTGIGFRIPTQALSSIAPIRVAGFLPQSMGHTIVVPSEITTMAGSDFDIDKMFMYLKSFYVDVNENIRIVEYKGSKEATKDFYGNVYEETFQKEIDKIEKFDEFRDRLVDIFEKLEQFDEISLDNLEKLSDEDFKFYQSHFSLFDEIISQADEERVSPRDYILDQIEKLNGEKEKFTQKLMNDVLKDKYVRKMYKRALENEYYDSLEKLVTLPKNYQRLISPVDDAGLKDVAKEIDDLTGDIGENVKGRLLNASYMTKLRHSFVTAKRWVGIAATNLTGHSGAQKAKIYIDPNRFNKISKIDKEILGDGKIALPYNKVKIGNKEYVSLSGVFTADKEKLYISSRLSGYTTTFVDVAKDPYIMKIIKSELAVGTFMFLERVGAGKTIPFFMNQPIIRNYLDQLEESNFRSLFSSEQISEILAEFPTSNSALEETQLDVSLQSLKKNMSEYRDNKGEMDETFNAMQQKILMEFLKYAKMAEYSFKLTQASNYDTSKFRSGDSLFRKQTRTSIANEENIFSSVNDLLDSSHLGVQAYYLDLSVKAVAKYLQIDKPEIRQNITDDLLRPYATDSYLSEDKFANIGMKVTTSLLDFIIQTKTGLNEQITELTSDGENSPVALLNKAKEIFPSDDLLQLLQPRQTRPGGPWTIALKGNMKDSAYDVNYFIGKMRELRDNEEEDTKELTTKLFKSLVKVSIIQGTQQTATSIKNVIPPEDYANELGETMRNIRYTPEMDAFALGMFQRNKWKDDEIFKTMRIGYGYANDKFPVIDSLGATRNSRAILTVPDDKYNVAKVKSDYLKVDRFVVKKSVDYDEDLYAFDLLTGNEYTYREYRTMLAKGETAPKEIIGYQKVKYDDGSPLIKYDKDGNKTFIYKRINLYGDGMLVSEYYNEFKESVLNNGTAHIKEEADNNTIIAHFTSKEVIKPNQEPVTGTSMVTFTPEETGKPPIDDTPFDITPTAPTAPVSGVEITKSNYTRENVRKNPNTAYVFTENTHSITAFPNTQGGGSAIIRPEPNAFAIVTKKKYDYNTRENVDYSDTPEDFAEFTEVNTKLIDNLRTSGKSKIVFPQGFATDKAKMPTRFAEWLQKALLDNFGLVTELNSTKTGLISKEVEPSYYEMTGEKPPLTYDEKIQKLNTIKGNLMIDFYGKFYTHTSVRNVSREFYENINSYDSFYVELREWLFDYREKMLGDLITGSLDMDSSEIIEKYTLHLQGKSFDKYQYYGAPYTIVIENGVGVDVVGYRGKPADKQKLLNAYNTNPNVDPQNGKPFIGVKPAETPASSVVTEEKFKFRDGIEIDVPFKLNSEQENALYSLEEFIKNPSKFDGQITLLGYAGTGKTSIISLFDKYLKKKYIKPIYTSPTHRANAVTKQKNPKAKVLTLHSLFGLGPNIKLEEGDYDIRDLEFASQNKPKIMGGETLIVDEASMVSEALYKFLENFKNSLGINIIYVGDPAQLKPVKDKSISPVFTKGTKLQLTKVERTGDNPILRESTNLRNGQDFSYVTDITPTGGVEYINNVNRVNQVIGENFSSQQFKDNPLYFRILSGTNAKVDEYNTIVRDLLFDTTEQLVKGDVLMGYNNFDVDYNTKEPVIVNSGDYQVIDVVKSNKTIRIGTEDLKFSGYSVILSNLMNPDDNLKNVFIVDNTENKEKIFKFIDQVAEYNKSGAKAMASGDRQSAATLFQMARTAESQLAFMRNLIDQNGKVKGKKTLGYGYAHTIHKSQGGTYNKVLILDDTIDAFKDASTRQQLKYVAMSRASEMVYVSTNQPLKERIKGEFDTTTEFTEEQKSTILSNFAAKHKMTEEAAKAYINDALTKNRNNVLKILKECY